MLCCNGKPGSSLNLTADRLHHGWCRRRSEQDCRRAHRAVRKQRWFVIHYAGLICDVVDGEAAPVCTPLRMLLLHLLRVLDVHCETDCCAE